MCSIQLKGGENLNKITLLNMHSQHDSRPTFSLSLSQGFIHHDARTH